MAFRRRNRSRRKLLLGLLLLIAVTVFVVDRTVDSGPLAKATGSVRDVFAWTADSLGGDGNKDVPSGPLAAENQRLRQELEITRSQLSVSADIDRQRRELAGVMNIPVPENTARRSARVTDIHLSNFDASVEIDKGTTDGVTNGMPVVNERGLVGRVADASPRYSKVVLVGDTAANTGVRIGSTGEIGVARGKGARRNLEIGLLEPDTPVAPGDVAVTSGLPGSVFPSGIPVGNVVVDAPAPIQPGRAVSLAPAVDFSRLDVVAVLQWSPR